MQGLAFKVKAFLWRDVYTYIYIICSCVLRSILPPMREKQRDNHMKNDMQETTHTVM